jgi:diphthamide biosynthesis protein 7
MSTITSIDSQILDLPPSCTEFSPNHPQYLVIGTYYLEKQEATGDRSEELGNEEAVAEASAVQQRNGSVILFRLENDKLRLIYSLPTNFAILDLHFDFWKSSHSPSDLFITANSTGSLAFYQIVLDNDSPSIVEQKSVCPLWDASILVLSFAFHPSNDTLIGATLSTGEVVLCRIDMAKYEVVSFLTSTSHTLEAWTLNFGIQPEQLFSGGDDAVIQRITLSEDLAESVQGDLDDFEPPSSVLWQNRKIHGAGVTAILPLTERCCLTGSYDDHVRIISVKNRPVCLSESNLGGGVWRLKLASSRYLKDSQPPRCQYDVIASCMHAGAQLLRIELDPTPTITVLAHFEEHQSMNYACDVQPADGFGDYTVVSTSFYDKRLCLWRYLFPT